MFERRYLLVLVVAAVFTSTYQQFERSVPSCTANGQRFCWSCNTQSTCISSSGIIKQYNTACSGSTPVCGPDTSTPPKMACTSNSVAGCTCQVTTGLSYQPDPYNDQWYIACSGSTPTYINCGDGKFYNEATKQCEVRPPPPDPCTAAGVYDNPDNCNGFYICESAGAIPKASTCSPPENYFNPAVNDCTAPESLFTCPPGEAGTFADPFDCRRYYVCFDTELFDVGCCDTTQIFDVKTESCIIGDIPGCPLSIECAV